MEKENRKLSKEVKRLQGQLTDKYEEVNMVFKEVESANSQAQVLMVKYQEAAEQIVLLKHKEENLKAQNSDLLQSSRMQTDRHHYYDTSSVMEQSRAGDQNSHLQISHSHRISGERESKSPRKKIHNNCS